jgi:arylamine N-acetyltransferase
MIKYIVDRIEGGYAVCFDENNKTEVPLDKFGFTVRESMVILFDKKENKYIFDKEATDKALEENEKKLKNLFGRE